MYSPPLSTDAFMPINARPAPIFVRGKGSHMWDESGRRYLDFVQGWAVNCLGHSPDALVGALAGQACDLIFTSPAYHNAPSLKLAAELARLSGLDHVFFGSSGAEANEGAIKLARKFGSLHRGGAFEIITFEGAFHGRTLATMSASGKKSFEPLFEPKVPGFPKARINDLASVENLIGANTVAVMLEPIQGEAGVIPSTPEFLRDLRALTKSRGLLLILDEIQTGVGRTGAMFDFQNAGIVPDILTLGKGIGGGVPLSALIATREASCFEPGDQGGTYCGNPLMCAAGLAVIVEVAKPTFLARAREAGERLAAGLLSLSAKHGLGEVRGRGLLLALDLRAPIGAKVVAEAFERGLLINSPRPDTLRFMPALNVSDTEIARLLAILDPLLAN